MQKIQLIGKFIAAMMAREIKTIVVAATQNMAVVFIFFITSYSK
jgi:hypothetical protein